MSMYNNTQSDNCVNNVTYDQALSTTKTIWHIFGISAVIIGTPGHILQIIILSNKNHRKDPTSLYFVAIACFEIMFLLGLFWLWCVNMSLIETDPREVLSCGVFYSILVGSASVSNLYLASSAIDRSIIILYPIRYRLIVTPAHVRLRILVLFILIILLVIPHHFYLYYDPRSTSFLCDFYAVRHGQHIRLLALIHGTFFVFAPSLIIFISSLILLHNRCKHNRTYKNNLSASARRLHRHSIIIFIYSLGLLLTLAPPSILQVFIIRDRFYHNIRCLTRLRIYKILMNSFLIFSAMNYSIKFYFHLLTSTMFRQDFIQLISCRQSKKPTDQPKQMNEAQQPDQRLLSTSDDIKKNTVEI